MTKPIQFAGEDRSNAVRQVVAAHEPAALRTYTPSQAVFAKSAGVFHYTPEGRRLYDFSSGVLVSNLGHNPRRWMRRFAGYMGWSPDMLFDAPSGGREAIESAAAGDRRQHQGADAPRSETSYCEAVTLTAYNGITEIETLAVSRLLKNLHATPLGNRLDTIMWAASGSEAIQKALWAALARDRGRDIILATRYGFHGKKGLANAVTGSETDADRDPRVRFISFPMEEVADHTVDAGSISLEKYEQELQALWRQFGPRLTCVITEPYLGGGGSYHPPAKYHQLLQRFCREHDLLFLFDEVQANFGRTGRMYAFEKYAVEPDMVILGKGLGNGVPVAAVACNSQVVAHLKYGEASDTWSANPLACAAVLATLDEFESEDLMTHVNQLEPMFFAGLDRLKDTGLVKHVRGEAGVYGIECAAAGDRTPGEVAGKIVEACYLGDGQDGIHLLGALAGKVLRIAPPLTITAEQVRHSLELMQRVVTNVAKK
jgi:4-aminobutyrate aminotransferase-like enzyme